MATVTFDNPIRIVTADEPTPVERTAAQTLAAYVQRITAVAPIVCAEADYRGEKALLVATKNIPFDAQEDYDAAELGEEGIFYAVSAQGVFFGGGSKRGVLYSVCSFLEDELGCRCYFDDFEKVPCAEQITAEIKTRAYVPPMHYRVASFHDGDAPACAVFNKINARSEIPEEAGGAIDFGIGYVHTLDNLIPNELFDTHPEYFPLINGKRSCGPHHQRCLTNPDVLAITIEKVKQDFRLHPLHKTASVSQADTDQISHVCECPACKKINDEEENLGASQLRFVNAVADAIKEEFPDRFIETLAYRFSRQVPKYTKPRDNVIIRLCSIECCFSHPLTDCDYRNPAFVADMRRWSAVAKHMYIWDYVTDFDHYLAPHPNLSVLKPNMQFFAKNNVVGMYPEGAYDAKGVELGDLKCWLLAKLMWDPDFDVEKGIEEFVKDYMGAAAPHMLRYIRRLSERPYLTGSHRTCYATPDRDFFSEEYMAACEADFAAAKAAAAGDQTLLNRIAGWEMPTRYIRIVLYADRFAPGEHEAEINRFLEDMPRLKIDCIREGTPHNRVENEKALRERIQY